MRNEAFIKEGVAPDNPIAAAAADVVAAVAVVGVVAVVGDDDVADFAAADIIDAVSVVALAFNVFIFLLQSLLFVAAAACNVIAVLVDFDAACVAPEADCYYCCYYFYRLSMLLHMRLDLLLLRVVWVLFLRHLGLKFFKLLRLI